jgi:hypothetical protein
LAKHSIKDIQLPDDRTEEHAYIAATTINGRWFIKFDGTYNRGDARDRVAKAEEFLKAAQVTESTRGYQLFHALEQAIHAYLIFSPGMKSWLEDTRSHHALKPQVNQEGQLGNISEEVVQLFNELLKTRATIYNRGKNPLLGDEAMKSVADFIATLKRRLAGI